MMLPTTIQCIRTCSEDCVLNVVLLLLFFSFKFKFCRLYNKCLEVDIYAYFEIYSR